MKRFYELVALAYFFAATILLLLLAALLLASAILDVVSSFATEDRVDVALNSIGLLIIGFAVVETAKFVAEEELLRQRELRKTTESRGSITKFVTILVIAASLEALVMIFKTGLSRISDAIYPAALFLAAMLGLVCLGLYQYLSRRFEREPGEHGAPGDDASSDGSAIDPERR